MAFPRAEVGNRVMIKRHASCSETPRFWGSSSNYNGDTVPFPSQHTTKGSVKRMPRSAHSSTAAGASHLLYPLSLKHPACRQAEKSIPFQYLKQQHVTRFLTPECDFLAGPYLLTLIFLISEVALAYTLRISVTSARIGPSGLKRRSLLCTRESTDTLGYSRWYLFIHLSEEGAGKAERTQAKNVSQTQFCPVNHTRS